MEYVILLIPLITFAEQVEATNKAISNASPGDYIMMYTHQQKHKMLHKSGNSRAYAKHFPHAL